jgi:hypothetical protein
VLLREGDHKIMTFKFNDMGPTVVVLEPVKININKIGNAVFLDGDFTVEELYEIITKMAEVCTVLFSMNRAEIKIGWYGLIHLLQYIKDTKMTQKIGQLISKFENLISDPITSKDNFEIEFTPNSLQHFLDGFNLLGGEVENAFKYRTMGADTFIGNTTVRLSELIDHLPEIRKIQERIEEMNSIKLDLIETDKEITSRKSAQIYIKKGSERALLKGIFNANELDAVAARIGF